MRYETAFQPPAPVLDVVVRNPYAPSGEYRCRAMLDTGAGISVVPQDAMTALGLVEAQKIMARSWDGTSREVVTCIVRMEFDGGVVPLVEVVVADRPTALLGRDVLNLFRLLLDGPALTLEILPST
jgi:predicted aspartyl protease